MIFAGDHSLVQGLKGDATYLVVTENSEIEKFGINGEITVLHFAQACVLTHMFKAAGLCSTVVMRHMMIRQIALLSRVYSRYIFPVLSSFCGCCSCVHPLGMRRAMERGEFLTQWRFNGFCACLLD